MNESYAIVGSYLLNATKRRGTGPVVYNPSCLSFAFPRQFRELAAIGNQWRFHNDVSMALRAIRCPSSLDPFRCFPSL